MSPMWEKEGKKGAFSREFSLRGVFVRFLLVIVTIYLRLKGSGSLPVYT